MMKFDIIADWALNKFCNFFCPYCYVSIKDRREVAYKGKDAQKNINAFNSSGKNCLELRQVPSSILHQLLDKTYVTIS